MNAHRRELQSIRSRIENVNINIKDSGLFADYIELVECWDDSLYSELLEDLEAIEQQTILHQYLPLPSETVINKGECLVANCVNPTSNPEITQSHRIGKPNAAYHTCCLGGTGGGKSRAQGLLASQASKHCATMIIDSNKTFRTMSQVWNTHRFIRDEDLRINPWDRLKGVPTNLSDAAVNKQIARHCSLQYGEYELNEACLEIRDGNREPNMRSMINFLKARRYPPGSRRVYYRDSAVLGLTSILNSSGDGSIYDCARGVSILELLDGNTVLEMSGLPSCQVFITALLLLRVELLVYAGVQLARPLVFFLDEGQILLNG